MTNSIVFENDIYRLVISEDCKAESLVLKSSCTECIYREDTLPFFTLTEERPYNNELKLEHPSKRTTFSANRVRREGDNLIVGFDIIKLEAVVTVSVKPEYMVFTLTDILVPQNAYGLGVIPIVPPVTEFRLIQLPCIPRERFGEWLNVMWDDSIAVNVLSTSPYLRISSEKRRDYRILYGESLRDVKLKGEGVALIVSETKRLLDVIDIIEADYDLPRGVQSRRNPLINRSYYKTTSADIITPENVDKHISYALAGGFKFMSIYYRTIFPETAEFLNTGRYDRYLPEFKNGFDDLKAMLDKIKAAGIIPGLHILHTHIGLGTPYLTPVADHRVNLVKQFTLAKPLSKTDTTIYVEENPENSPTYEKTRVLKFMGELISYESYTTERPYKFIGCKRGFNSTVVRSHEVGTIGGILDISEFCANSAYIDQRTSLQDEVADNIAEVYKAGFEFIYYDGSEGTSAPFDINVGLAQWRVYKKLDRKPIFCEGAAKSHFSWHILSGGNAFDLWTPDVFKEMIVEHPYKEAIRTSNDFTRLNFGWWRVDEGQSADRFEYATSLAAAWDCPGGLFAELSALDAHPRMDDILKTIRVWEDARASGFITDGIKAELRNTNVEHTLLVNEKGELELLRWEEVKGLSISPEISVFLFSRGDKTCAAIWHNIRRANLSLNARDSFVSYLESFDGGGIEVDKDGENIILPVENKRYLVTDMTPDMLKAAFRKALII